MKAYLDNGATTMVDRRVVEAMLPYFTEKYGNASSLYSLGKESKKALAKARETIARTINAEPEEIIFTSGGTESDNYAIKGLAYADKGKKTHIITTKIEHHAILETCEHLEKQGFRVTYLDVDKEGFISLEQLKKAITKDTLLVSVMHANNEIGTIQDLAEIGKICREKGVFFHTDAVQSYTKTHIDVKAMNIDLASFSGHKVHGPKGIGALYVRKGIALDKQSDGGGQESKRRAGTENIPGIVGFAKAAELADNKEHIKRIAELRDMLIEKLRDIPDSTINGPLGEKRLCNNVNIRFNYVEGEAMLIHLDLAGVAVSTGSACSSASLKPSHVLMAIGLKRKDSHGTLRLTLSRFTTEEEIEYAADTLKGIIAKLREYSPLNARTIDEYDDADEGRCEH